MILQIENDGPAIRTTNYWGSEADRVGAMHLSPNAGAFRLLLPSGWESAIAEMETATVVVVSRGPMQGRDAIELLFDDGTADPFAVHLGAGQCTPLPVAADAGRQFVLTVWTNRRGKPHQSLSRPAWYRIVPRLPWLKPWGKP